MLTPEQETEAERRQHFVLKQLVFFWPFVSNGDDVDRVEHLNYGLCITYAAWNLVSGFVEIVMFHKTPVAVLPILLVLSTAVFYFLGGNAVRRNSVPAAWAMAVYTLSPLLLGIIGSRFDDTMILFFLASLVVLRGTSLTASWRRNEVEALANPLRMDQALPLQFDHRLFRFMADRWSPIFWPRMQWLFWLTGTLLFAEPIVLAALILRDRGR